MASGLSSREGLEIQGGSQCGVRGIEVVWARDRYMRITSQDATFLHPQLDAEQTGNPRSDRVLPAVL